MAGSELLAGEENSGIQLTQTALSIHVGEWGSMFIAVAIFLLSPVAFALFRDYDRQLKAGLDSIFDPFQFPKLVNKADPSAWPKRSLKK
ncbi:MULTISPECIES: hypothetical protein [Halomonadaceae]|uniref:hypothetical protein n=1 Tax=Halomonadaceae TaxID=28256 RepID=UPI00200C590A|nr:MULTISPECIES: hypothetical protein [Halomonas]